MSEVKVNKISPRTNCGTVTVGDSGDSVSVTAGVPVTVNGDLKSNALKATDGGSIISQSGTTITLGASGDTIALSAGASQTGFGRTGTVDWQTGSIKTSTFTAVSGEGYFVNTTGGVVTANLPSSPSAGDIVAIADYAGTSGSNSITIGRNGSNIEGVAQNGEISSDRDTITLVYVDGTQGWLAVNDNESSFIAPGFVAASGGTITTVCTNFKVHTFTGPGTFTVTCAGNTAGSSSVDYMIIAGGGGGGGSRSPGGGSGGGGAGGWRASNGTASGTYSAAPGPLAPSLTAPVSAITVTAQGYPITVGAAGPGAPSGNPTSAGSGSNSSGLGITSAGGGAGGSPNSPQLPGVPGGSGGGAPWQSNTVGTGNTPPVSPPQGNNGGVKSGNPNYSGGGGGGAGSVGGAACAGSTNGGTGGSSLCSSIDGSPKSYAGGGGGGSSGPAAGGAGGGAGAGSGGRPGSPGPGTNASDANRGSGGGAGGQGGLTGGGNGAAGVVVIRYKFQ
jgi:hypothetical protein